MRAQKPGDLVTVVGAAGGVGQILTAKLLEVSPDPPSTTTQVCEKESEFLSSQAETRKYIRLEAWLIFAAELLQVSPKPAEQHHPVLRGNYKILHNFIHGGLHVKLNCPLASGATSHIVQKQQGREIRTP